MDRREEFSNIPTEPPAPNRNGRDDMRGANAPSRTTEDKPFPSTISDEDLIDEDDDYYYAANDESLIPLDTQTELNWWERQTPVAKAIIVILPLIMVGYFGMLIVLFVTSTRQAISPAPTSGGSNALAQATNTLPVLLLRSPLVEAATSTPQPNINNIPTVTPRPTPTPAPTPTLLPTPAATTAAPVTTTTAPKPTTAQNNAATNTQAATATPTLAPAATTTQAAPVTTPPTPAKTTSAAPATTPAPAKTTSATPATTTPATSTTKTASATPTATKTP